MSVRTDAFREGPNLLVIDPNDCIDCTLWVPECPAEAIFSDDDLPADQRDFIAINAELAKRWKYIVARKAALPDANEWAKVKDKRGQLDRGCPWLRATSSITRRTPLMNLHAPVHPVRCPRHCQALSPRGALRRA